MIFGPILTPFNLMARATSLHTIASFPPFSKFFHRSIAVFPALWIKLSHFLDIMTKVVKVIVENFWNARYISSSNEI